MEDDPRDKELDGLFAAARGARLYDAESEQGFENRVMAKIRAMQEDRMRFLFWAWRLIPVFASLLVLIGIWLYTSESRSMIDLSAITRIGNEETMLTAFLTGE